MQEKPTKAFGFTQTFRETQNRHKEHLPNTDIRYTALLYVINCISFTTGLKYEMLIRGVTAFPQYLQYNIVQ